MMIKNLGITDYAVLRGIEKLSEEKQYFSAEDIATEIWGERTAVYRSLKRLKQAKLIKVGEGSPSRGGCKYEYIGK